MSDTIHCPFLNRSDARCGSHFSLTGLGSAFDHCFGSYGACPTYRELLDERRERQGQPHAYPQMVSLRLPVIHAA